MGLKGDIKNVMDEFVSKSSRDLQKKYTEYSKKNDLSERQKIEKKVAHQFLEERGEVASGQEEVSEKQENKGSTIGFAPEPEEGDMDSGDQNKNNNGTLYKHKIISGPVLSGQDKLENKLSELGESGWILLDTQRHSIASKQHAVCFLRKKVSSKVAEQNDKLDEVNDQLSKLLALQNQIIEQMDQEEGGSRWKHKIISGPVLSGQDKLQNKLNELGKSGWELVDTQRHSIAAKQHAVCFLKKKK